MLLQINFVFRQTLIFIAFFILCFSIYLINLTTSLIFRPFSFSLIRTITILFISGALIFASIFFHFIYLNQNLKLERSFQFFTANKTNEWGTESLRWRGERKRDRDWCINKYSFVFHFQINKLVFNRWRQILWEINSMRRDLRKW